MKIESSQAALDGLENGCYDPAPVSRMSSKSFIVLVASAFWAAQAGPVLRKFRAKSRRKWKWDPADVPSEAANVSKNYWITCYNSFIVRLEAVNHTPKFLALP